MTFLVKQIAHGEMEPSITESDSDTMTDIHLDCPICFVYNTDFNSLQNSRVTKNLLEIDVAYLGDNWIVEPVRLETFEAAQLTSKDLVHTTIQIYSNHYNVVESSSPKKFQSNYDYLYSELINFFALRSHYNSVDDLIEHIEANHKDFLINARDKEACLQSTCIKEIFFPIVKKSLKSYVRLALRAQQGDNLDLFDCPFKTCLLILRLLQKTLFSTHTFFPNPLTEELEKALTNIITLRQLFELANNSQ